MKKKLIIGFITIFSVVSGMAYAADTKPQAQSDIKRTVDEVIGKWRYQCEAVSVGTEKKAEICALVQNFAATDKDNKQQAPVMRLQLHHDKEKNFSFLGVRTPLGIHLASGITMSVAGKEFKTVPFTTCFAEMLGCRASFELDKALDDTLRNNKKVEMSYKTLTGGAVKVDLETDGYAKALEKLKK